MLVTLYTKPGCTLCDELKADLLLLQEEIGFSLVERNIEEDPDDYARFQYLIPVLDIDGGALHYPPHTWSGTYAALKASQQP